MVSRARGVDGAAAAVEERSSIGLVETGVLAGVSRRAGCGFEDCATKEGGGVLETVSSVAGDVAKLAGFVVTTVGMDFLDLAGSIDVLVDKIGGAVLFTSPRVV